MVQVVSILWIEDRVLVRRLNRMIGAIPVFYGHLVIYPPAAFPSCQDYGERSLHPEREGGSLGQVAKERVSFLHCGALHGYQLGWRQRLGQVCGLHREFRLVSSLPHQRPRTPPYVLITQSSVPLCYVYPPLLHYKACARTRKEKAGDIALLVFGVLAAVYTTAQTIRVGLHHQSIPSSSSSHFALQLMFEPETGGPTFGQC